jgi:hypothetical protein
MITRARALSIVILLTLISGCTNQPVPLAVTPTFTPFQANVDNPTPTPGTPLPVPQLPNSTSISVSALTFTPAPEAVPPDFSPILYGRKYDANTFLTLLGGVQGGTWLTVDQAASNFGGGAEYDVYTLAKEDFQVYGNAPEFSPTQHQYFISTDIAQGPFGMVGVVHGWPVRQGDVQELSFQNNMYEDIVLDWLKTEGGIQTQLDSLHIYRVDLEADGVDEIFISATHLDSSQHTTRAGDYSILLMRKVVGNQAVTLPIVADVYRSEKQESTFPNAYSFANFIDLNQDGVLEVVIDIQHWETDQAAVYQVNGQEIIKVF